VRLAPALLALALLLAGCQSPGPGEPGTGATEAPETTAAPSATSSSVASASSTASPGPPASPGPAAPAAENRELVLEHGGRQRRAEVYVPPGLPAGEAIPLLIVLHPALTSAAAVRGYGLDAEAERLGFIVAYPEGTPEPDDPAAHTWNAGYCCGQGRDSGSDDVGFVLAVIARLRADYPVDGGHVGVAGHSNGGMLAHRVAASSGGVVSSLMVVAGSVGGQVDRSEPVQRVPAPGHPVSALLVHARDDSVVAYEGGNPSGPFEPRRIDLSVHEAVALWKQADGLSGEGQATASDQVTTTSWTGGLQGTELVFVSTQGGHGWPGVTGGQPPFFRSPAEPKATPLVAGFFMAHPGG
jgi:polyhydroxybutyrate depolymerase